MTKSTSATITQRVGLVASLILKGYGREDIVRYGSKKYSVSERQIDDYLAKAKELIKASVTKDVDMEFAKAMRRYEILLRLAFKRKDFKEASQINDKIVGLLGLTKHKVEQSGSIQFICNLSEE